jgi:hypothetical protein
MALNWATAHNTGLTAPGDTEIDSIRRALLQAELGPPLEPRPLVKLAVPQLASCKSFDDRVHAVSCEVQPVEKVNDQKSGPALCLTNGEAARKPPQPLAEDIKS